MIKVHDSYYQPSLGYKYLTNGEIYSNSVYLGKADSPDNWHDTNDEPPEPGHGGSELETELAEAAKILLGVSE